MISDWCNTPGLLGFTLDVQSGKSPDDLATRRDRWRCDGDWRTSQSLLSNRSELERMVMVGVYGIRGLRHGITISTRIARRD